MTMALFLILSLTPRKYLGNSEARQVIIAIQEISQSACQHGSFDLLYYCDGVREWLIHIQHMTGGKLGAFVSPYI